MSDASMDTESPGSGRSAGVIVAVAVGAVVLVVVAAGVLFFREVNRKVPGFPSLAARPDPSLHGTVAYFSDRDRCVRVISASSARSKQVLCLPSMDVSKAKVLGKEMGPQLVWLDGGRLEITMFRATGPKLETYGRGWQKVVDVRTGKVTDTPEVTVPSSPNLDTHATVSPGGEAVAFSTAGDTGKVKVTLSGPSGPRTLLSARGPSNYSILTAFWSPDYKWIAADDGRILVITTGANPVTRVLTDESSAIFWGGDNPRYSRFAVTKDDLLAAAK